MANTTFSGPVRSQHGFQSVLKNTTTGVYTPTYLDVKFDFTGMTHAVVATGTGVSLPINQVSTVNFTGGSAGTFVLPAATVGAKVAYVQSIDTLGGLNTLTIDALTTDAWVTGSLIESRTGGAVVYDTSDAGEGSLVHTPGNVVTNLFSIGSVLYFSCWEKGLWHVGMDSAKDFAAISGEFAFAA
tara:strand:+ start:31 stop:585 length:555 start_codon:yes stop_codon:yes gene_type:complete